MLFVSSFYNKNHYSLLWISYIINLLLVGHQDIHALTKKVEETNHHRRKGWRGACREWCRKYKRKYWLRMMRVMVQPNLRRLIYQLLLLYPFFHLRALVCDIHITSLYLTYCIIIVNMYGCVLFDIDLLRSLHDIHVVDTYISCFFNILDACLI